MTKSRIITPAIFLLGLMVFAGWSERANACLRCVVTGETIIHCISGFINGGQACFTTTVSCYTSGICSYGPPSPPLDPYSVEQPDKRQVPGHVDCYQESELGFFGESRFLNLSSTNSPVVKPNNQPVVELISALSMGRGQLPVGPIASGAYFSESGEPITFTGEISMDTDQTARLYFEFLTHPELDSLYAEMPISQRRSVDYSELRNVQLVLKTESSRR
jgi:hypothetical protein